MWVVWSHMSLLPTTSYNTYGFVKLLTAPPSGRRVMRKWYPILDACDNVELHPALMSYIGKRLKSMPVNTRAKVFPVEYIRYNQRRAARPTTSVIVFACQSHDPDALQSTVLPYALAAAAVAQTTDSYRMIICNENASQDSLSAELQQRGMVLPDIPIEFRPNISHQDQLLGVLNSIGDDERLSLCYISSHGSETGLIGHWTSTTPSQLDESILVQLCEIIARKRSADAQVFFNACYSHRFVAPFCARIIGDIIVMGANNAIPTGTIHHQFSPDVVNGRLYGTFNCIQREECEIFASYAKAATLDF